MSRPFGTALLAVVLAAAFTGTAHAESRAPGALATSTTTTTPTALEAGAVSMSASDAVATAPAPAAAPESAEMPGADADLHMWSSRGEAAALLPTAPIHAASGAKAGDPIHRFARGILSRTSSIAMSLTRSAMRFIGTPYVFGGTSTSGFDCSGYTQHVFAMLGIRLPRTADAQFDAGRPTRGGMTTGDLVFFQTYEPGPSHVGIYVGSGKFIHSSSHGVMVSRLADRYWSSRYLGAKRVATFHE